MESQVTLRRSWSWSFVVEPQEGEVWPDTKEPYQSTLMRPTQLGFTFHAGTGGKVSYDSPSVTGLNVKKDGTTGSVQRHVSFSAYVHEEGWPDYVKRYVSIARLQVEAETAAMREAITDLGRSPLPDRG